MNGRTADGHPVPRAGLPRISIVTCSFQQGRYLEATMRSVLEQDYPDLEYLVIDGGSSDGSVATIRRHADRLAYWVSEPDRGQTHALVKGLERASGEIMGWLCSDDLLLPGALATVGAFFVANPGTAAVYGDSIWIDADGHFLRPKKEMPFNRFVFLHDHNYVPQPSMFWRASLYRAAGGLDEAFDLAMDGELWERYSRLGRIAYLPRYLSCMRSYPRQKTRSLRARARQEDARIRERGLAFARHVVVERLMRTGARVARIALKMRAGGYTARVPTEHLEWLDRMARGARRRCS